MTRLSSRERTLHAVFALVFIGWTALMYYADPSRIVDSIGAQNGYLVAFVLAFFGGLSIFTAVPYYLAVITLGAGGLDPLALGAAAGTGLILGDSTSYLIGYHGREILPRRYAAVFARLADWCARRPGWGPPAALFFYGAFVPLSNDLVVISLGLGRYPYWQVMLPLGLGNIVFNTLLAYGGAAGLSRLPGVF